MGTLSGLAIAYIVLAGFIFFTQKNLIYFPERNIQHTPADIGLVYEDFFLRTEDGLNISAWFIPSEKQRGVVLFCHGNAGNISHRLDSIRIFHSLGLSVLIFDYRGYGKSDGSPSEKGTYLDAQAAWDHLVRNRNIPPGKIVLFGRSLGSAVAADTAISRGGGLLILESGFTSVPELAGKYYPFLPVRLLSRYSYATVDKIGKIRMPKLIIHSPEDEIIPYAHGVALFERALDPKRMLNIKGGHNEGFLLTGRDYIRGLGAFISQYL